MTQITGSGSGGAVVVVAVTAGFLQFTSSRKVSAFQSEVYFSLSDQNDFEVCRPNAFICGILLGKMLTKIKACKY